PPEAAAAACPPALARPNVRARPTESSPLLALGVAAGDHRPELAERLGELRRDDPDLVRFALRDLRQHLEVLVGEQLRVGVALVDRLEDGADRLRLALRVQDLRLALALGAQDRALLLALRREDL